ncbi:MAG: hypothetical protein Q4Q30_06540, partial [Eggerthella sp.]|nr:hypothetical protein [Eggerthella sp.]
AAPFSGKVPGHQLLGRDPISQSQKQKTELFCNFFAIRDSHSLLQSGKEASYSHFCCIFGP